MLEVEAGSQGASWERWYSERFLLQLTQNVRAERKLRDPLAPRASNSVHERT